jgi:hypothetical protein
VESREVRGGRREGQEMQDSARKESAGLKAEWDAGA